LQISVRKIQTAHTVALIAMVVANARLMPDDDDADDANADFDESQAASEGTERRRRKSTGEGHRGPQWLWFESAAAALAHQSACGDNSTSRQENRCSATNKYFKAILEDMLKADLCSYVNDRIPGSTQPASVTESIDVRSPTIECPVVYARATVVMRNMTKLLASVARIWAKDNYTVPSGLQRADYWERTRRQLADEPNLLGKHGGNWRVFSVLCPDSPLFDDPKHAEFKKIAIPSLYINSKQRVYDKDNSSSRNMQRDMANARTARDISKDTLSPRANRAPAAAAREALSAAFEAHQRKDFLLNVVMASRQLQCTPLDIYADLKRAEDDLLEFERASNERAAAPRTDAPTNETEAPSAQATRRTVDADRDDQSPPRELHAHGEDAVADVRENVVPVASDVERDFNFTSPPPPARMRTRTRSGQSPASVPPERRDKRARTTPSRFAQ
jgi:hypothetical protein